MKRIFSLLLAFVMIFSLFSCSGTSGKDEGGEKEEKDLASLTAVELYQRAVEKNKNLKSAYYETRVFLNDTELSTIETRRVREGYDSFDYSRKGREEIYFVSGTAYLSGDNGKFSAPATARSFEQYMAEFVFPVYGMDSGKFFEATREKNTVSYTVTAKDLFSLYGSVLDQDEFTPQGMTGVATISEEAVLTSEVITLNGVGRDGTNATLTLKTTLCALRDESIKVTLPEGAESFLALSDIRLPEKIVLAVENLYKAENLQATMVHSCTVQEVDKLYAFYQDTNIYRATDSNTSNYYLSRQSLKQIPKKPEESLFYQCLVKDGVKTENQYNVITGTLLSENIGSATTLSWQNEVEAILPTLSDFATLTMTEDLGGYSITFTLSQKAAQDVFGSVLSRLPESGKDAAAFTVAECSGTLSVSKEKGLLNSLTYTVKGNGAAEGETIGGRFSFLLDQTENITLPPLQNPTPTTPGQGA